MAVYTHLDEEELAELLLGYKIGTAVSCKGIAEGVENSNYFLLTEQGRYILTIYEKRVAPQELPFFLNFMEHLSKQNILCPVPVYGKNGQALQKIQNKPMAITTFLDGLSIEHVTPEHAQELGTALACLHLAGQNFLMTRKNPLSVNGWKTLYARVQDTLKKSNHANEISAVLDRLEQQWPTDLPAGLIHADLFPDNVLFQNNHISGLIDFYFACQDFFAYDLAICVNAWCFDQNNQWDGGLATALLQGYHQIRPLSANEQAAFPILAQGAALRFFLTRTEDGLHVAKDALVQLKDPEEYLEKIRFHQTDSARDLFAAIRD